MHKLLTRSFAAIACCVVCASTLHAADPPLPATLVEQIQLVLHTNQASGAAVVLVDGLGVSGAYWQGDLQASTCQPAGAAGDALVAIAAMRLAESGKVDLYAPLGKSAGRPLRCKSQLTLGHLLEHTGNLPRACPGAQTAYSPADAPAAALALEKATKTTITKLMQREVFKPLGMQSSQWGGTPTACAEVAAQDTQGVVTTPQDIAALVQMLVQRGQVETQTFLPPCSIERMSISVSAASRPGGNTPAAIDQAKYGFGLERFKAGGQPWLGYSGDLIGSRWVWAYSSQSQNGMVIMLKSADAKTLRALRETVAKHLHEDAVLLTQR